MNYLYDGTYEGFLTCVYEHYYTEKADGICVDSDYQLDLTVMALSVQTDEAKAARVREAIELKISRWDAQRIYRAHCTCEPGKEMGLLRYIEMGFKLGGKLRLLHGNDTVLAVQKAELRLSNEVHRLLGLVRFSEKRIAGVASRTRPGQGLSFPVAAAAPEYILYAAVEPDNDCLEFLAPHFTDRLKEEPFIIHDLRRGKALAAYRKKWAVMPFDAEDLLRDSEGETIYADLWQKYWNTMAIKERKNRRCQRNLMPARYWKHLPETRLNK
jgi:probable DNA metabolism protein